MNEPLTCLHTEAMTAEREWTVDDVPALSAAVSLPEPVPAADRVSRRIRRYYQLQCRSFLRYCEKALLPQAAAEVRAALEASQPLPRFQAELTYQVTYNSGGLWSLRTQSRESGPGWGTVLLRRGREREGWIFMSEQISRGLSTETPPRKNFNINFPKPPVHT